MALDMNSNDLTIREMCRLGRDVLENRDMQALRTFPQHGTVSRYEHCLAVCYIALGQKEHGARRAAARFLHV